MNRINKDTYITVHRHHAVVPLSYTAPMTILAPSPAPHWCMCVCGWGGVGVVVCVCVCGGGGAPFRLLSCVCILAPALPSRNQFCSVNEHAILVQT